MARYVSLDIDDSLPEVTKAILVLAEVTVEEWVNDAYAQGNGGV